MAEILADVLEHTDVAIISGGQFGQFESQVIRPLAEVGAASPPRLHLLPACGTQYYRVRSGEWVRLYAEKLTDDEKGRAVQALTDAASQLGLWPENAWGEVIEDRESQVTFSALGQQAPLAEKATWDPSGDRKRRLRDAVATLIPDLEVRTGGTTSLDITRRGRDKAYGIGRLCEHTNRTIDEILFFGDQLQPGGNDHPVLAQGVACVAVTQWSDTAQRLRARLDLATKASCG